MKKFEANIVFIGDMAEEFKSQNMIILFDSGAPEELKEISVVHRGGIYRGEVVPGDFLFIGAFGYRVTSVGEVANKNLKNIGHVCLKFDGSTVPELPGNIHLEEKALPDLKVGDEIYIVEGQEK